MKKTIHKAPAKINLTLEIIRKLPNGYHEIRSVMLKSENLYDVIKIEFKKNNSDIEIESDNQVLPKDSKNICWKVAEKFFERLGKKVGLKINIQKNIPLGAGMGGGSTDGAIVLQSLNEYYDHPFSMKKLIEIASQVGKDIPFFFSENNTSLIEGMGEKLTKNIKAPKLNILAINPKIEIPTGWAYHELSKKLWFQDNKNRTNISNKMIGAIQSKDTKSIGILLYNDFEFVIGAAYPIIKEIKQSLLAFGAINAIMTGSGSTVFGIFESKKELQKAQKILKNHYSQFLITQF